jgi:hypothetical protein
VHSPVVAVVVSVSVTVGVVTDVSVAFDVVVAVTVLVVVVGQPSSSFPPSLSFAAAASSSAVEQVDVSLDSLVDVSLDSLVDVSVDLLVDVFVSVLDVSVSLVDLADVVVLVPVEVVQPPSPSLGFAAASSLPVLEQFDDVVLVEVVQPPSSFAWTAPSWLLEEQLVDAVNGTAWFPDPLLPVTAAAAGPRRIAIRKPVAARATPTVRIARAYAIRLGPDDHLIWTLPRTLGKQR